MTVLTIADMKTAFWLLLKSDTGAASVAARAALGADATSVITRKQFQVAGPAALPTRPIAVVEYGPSPGQRGFVRDVLPTWWLYDDAIQEWERLNPLQALIEAIYVEDAIPYCYCNYAGGIGGEQIDPALSLPVLAMRYQVRGRF